MIYIRAILVCLCITSICSLTSYFVGVHNGEKNILEQNAKAVSAFKDREAKLLAELADAKLKRQDQYGKGSNIIEHVPDATDCFDDPVPDVAYVELLDAAHR